MFPSLPGEGVVGELRPLLIAGVAAAVVAAVREGWLVSRGSTTAPVTDPEIIPVVLVASK